MSTLDDKLVTKQGLARFKDNCDETYAPINHTHPGTAQTSSTEINYDGNGHIIPLVDDGGTVPVSLLNKVLAAMNGLIDRINTLEGYVYWNGESTNNGGNS